MKKLFLVILALAVGIWIGGKVHAQSGPIQIQSSISHTSCTVTVSVTTYCFANDGLFVSSLGAAFTQIGAATAGVTSVTVCNAAGTVCGTPQAGIVSLNIPKTATATLQ